MLNRSSSRSGIVGYDLRRFCLSRLCLSRLCVSRQLHSSRGILWLRRHNRTSAGGTDLVLDNRWATGYALLVARLLFLSTLPVANERRFRLRCSACAHVTVIDFDEAVSRLRQHGHFRRADADSAEVVLALLELVAASWSCDRCPSNGLAVTRDHRLAACEEESAWENSRPCAKCRRSIAPERLEALPNATLCIACETGSRDANHEEPSFCTRCGARMEVARSRRAGPTRYILECPICHS